MTKPISNTSPMSGIAEEIRKALDAAHEYTLFADTEPHPGNENLQYWVGDHYDGIGAYVSYEDAYLAANAPTWLRTLLEENERIIKERDKWEAKARIQYRLHNEMIEEARSYREELEQVKKERDAWENHTAKATKQIGSLRSQLAEKDKVLEWAYRLINQNSISEVEGMTWIREYRSILSRYKGEETK